MTDRPSPLADGISVVIPVYNSGAGLAALVSRLEPVLPSLSPEYELVFVNDASPDDSQQRIEALAASRPWIRWVELRRNYGQHAAVLCGLREARYATTVTMDDDLQHRPELIRTLLDALTDDVDVVYGAPEVERHGLLRDAASRLTKWALSASMGADVATKVSAFRVLRTELRGGFAAFDGSYVQVDVLLTWVTKRFAALRVPHDERRVGRSNYTLGKLARVAMELVTGFSERPLRIASVVGLVFALFGMAILAYVLYMAIFVGTLPGFAFLASSIAVFSGVQLVALGVIGEYLARVHSRTMRRPTYFVRRRAHEEGGGS